jgi:hypothetical protein
VLLKVQVLVRALVVSKTPALVTGLIKGESPFGPRTGKEPVLTSARKYVSNFRKEHVRVATVPEYMHVSDVEVREAPKHAKSVEQGGTGVVAGFSEKSQIDETSEFMQECQFAECGDSVYPVSVVPNNSVDSANVNSGEFTFRFSPVLHVDFWRRHLPLVYTAEDAKFLLDAICDGVDVGRPVAAESLESPNWQSAIAAADQVSEVIAADVAAGRVLGPFREPPFEVFIVSPLGAVPKKGSGIRVIHDLSYPCKGSVNSMIDKDLI